MFIFIIKCNEKIVNVKILANNFFSSDVFLKINFLNVSIKRLIKFLGNFNREKQQYLKFKKQQTDKNSKISS